MDNLETPKWELLKYDKLKTYQLGDLPELIHVFKIRNNEYMVVYEDGYDFNTGKLDFFNKEDLEEVFNIVAH